MKNSKRITDILNKLTLEEKVALGSGQNFWMTKDLSEHGLPAMFMCDGPHGLRKQEISKDGSGADMLGINNSAPATCFPAAVTCASSWDTELMERVGEAIGTEALSKNVGLVLGPGANIKRNPLCGRNFEYFSEDPHLSGKMAASVIKGIQKTGVGASLKHFACNNQELSRFTSDSVIDERTLREIYLASFEIAVKEAAPFTVMCAYPKINGVHCSDNRLLLNNILRDEWGFDGAVITDWGAMNDRIEGYRAGCDLNMPGGSEYMEKDAVQAVRENKLSESDVNASAGRVLKLMINADENAGKNSTFSEDDHYELAREAAEKGAVLLKNEGILPLSKTQKVVIIGSMAKAPRYQGSGSSHINPYRITSPLEAISGCTYVKGCEDNGDTDEKLLKEAAEAAAGADVAVVFAGLPDRYESEGYDRENMKMPEGHLKMIDAVLNANPNTVVVLMCGCVVECPWADSVKAILYMGLGGEAVGDAARNLLYGYANPSGRLAESWPYKYEDCVCSGYYGMKDALYKEGIYVGYRYYDKAQVPVRWKFGHGLSYTSFKYSDLKAHKNTVSVSVTNMGKRAGEEAVLMYMEAPHKDQYRCVRELKDFKKVYLEPGESKTLNFELNDRSFAVWEDGWKVPEGTYRININDQSCEISPQGEHVEIKSDKWFNEPEGDHQQSLWEEYIGCPYKSRPLKKGEFTMDDTIMDMKEHSLIMKIMYKAVVSTIGKSFPKEQRTMDNPEYKMLVLSSAGGPLRAMQITGGIKGELFQGLLEIANGHFFRGLKKIIKK